MKLLVRSCLLCLASIASWSHAAAPDPSLIGCWRAVKIVLYSEDGSKAEDTSGRCTLQFKEGEFESACGTAGGTVTTTYRYQVVRPNVYAATLARSTLRTDLAASAREYQYHVDGNRLVTVSIPHGNPAGGPAAKARVETEAERVPCP